MNSSGKTCIQFLSECVAWVFEAGMAWPAWPFCIRFECFNADILPRVLPVPLRPSSKASMSPSCRRPGPFHSPMHCGSRCDLQDQWRRGGWVPLDANEWPPIADNHEWRARLHACKCNAGFWRAAADISPSSVSPALPTTSTPTKSAISSRWKSVDPAEHWRGTWRGVVRRDAAVHGLTPQTSAPTESQSA
jgi:hypothetical protein